MIVVERQLKAETVNFFNIRKRSDTQYDLQVGLLSPLETRILASYKTLTEAQEAMNEYYNALQRGEVIRIWRID